MMLVVQLLHHLPPLVVVGGLQGEDEGRGLLALHPVVGGHVLGEPGAGDGVITHEADCRHCNLSKNRTVL